MSDKQFIINVDEKDPDFILHIQQRLVASQNRDNLVTLQELKKRLASHRKKLAHAEV